MTWPGCGSGSTIRCGSGHFVVVARGLGGNLYRIERGEFFVGQLGDVHRSAVQASQALIFLGREEHDIVAAMTGHDDGLSMGDTAEAAELALKFARRDSGHGSLQGRNEVRIIRK